MKRHFFIISLLAISIAFFISCKDDTATYAEELEAERELIEDFISRQQIKVVEEMPAEFPWPDKVYYKSKSGLYFRLTNRGDYLSSDSIVYREQIVTKYDQYGLGVKPDTISTQSTVQLAHPKEFTYGDHSQACVAWHEAVGYMKYNNAEAQLIVPSKIGFSNFSRPATPVGYDLTIRVLRN